MPINGVSSHLTAPVAYDPRMSVHAGNGNGWLNTTAKVISWIAAFVASAASFAFLGPMEGTVVTLLSGIVIYWLSNSNDPHAERRYMLPDQGTAARFSNFFQNLRFWTPRNVPVGNGAVISSPAVIVPVASAPGTYMPPANVPACTAYPLSPQMPRTEQPAVMRYAAPGLTPAAPHVGVGNAAITPTPAPTANGRRNNGATRTPQDYARAVGVQVLPQNVPVGTQQTTPSTHVPTGGNRSLFGRLLGRGPRGQH